ncbi:type VI secretion system baseplate subunit TssE [Paraburkholderia phymatum]|uniref:Type VI secretion system lysozyme-related protein n=1 Tax=Paraburkholderia phymatum (strain DSM 17167 / CIP 108236 / LMG 21445 / STM815) TaxID=391038 RepID=B2JVR7_PARP8|nr:type VI secretion system baseplate subunit TssE [Paraburkholderia phymatum]ACC75044.1 type VI secretion system lysozyme-related protein [Paraburkholderia phymatum STM815]
MPAIVSSSSMPLFDRLAASGDAQLSGAHALRESVARELSRLLNTRSRLTIEAFLESEGTVLEYGVPDFSERSLHSGPDRDAIASVVKRAITLFEPRLVNIVVGFVFPSEYSAHAVLTIGADIRSGADVAHVAFDMATDGHVVASTRGADEG